VGDTSVRLPRAAAIDIAPALMATQPTTPSSSPLKKQLYTPVTHRKVAPEQYMHSGHPLVGDDSETHRRREYLLQSIPYGEDTLKNRDVQDMVRAGLRGEWRHGIVNDGDDRQDVIGVHPTYFEFEPGIRQTSMNLALQDLLDIVSANRQIIWENNLILVSSSPYWIGALISPS
jgi:hypothetical protein